MEDSVQRWRWVNRGNGMQRGIVIALTSASLFLRIFTMMSGRVSEEMPGDYKDRRSATSDAAAAVGMMLTADAADNQSDACLGRRRRERETRGAV